MPIDPSKIVWDTPAPPAKTAAIDPAAIKWDAAAPTLASPAAGPAATAQPSTFLQDAGNALKSGAAGVGAGVGQVALGAQDLVGKGLTALGATKAGNWLTSDAAAGKANLQTELQPYRDASPTAANIGEVGGQIAATLPVGGLIGGGLKGVAALGAAPRILAPLAESVASSGVTGSNLATRALGGAISGGASAALVDPESAGTGAAIGATVPSVVRGIGRLISPNASTNEGLQLLMREGVQPTIGQTLGGGIGRAEEKLTSVPILGDAIAAARGRAQQQFNNAAINRATDPIGVKVAGAGQDAVGDAGKALSKAYDDAAAHVTAFNFDPKFTQDLSQLQGMTQTLTPQLQKVFDQKLNDVLLRKTTNAGGLLGAAYKNVDSELGQVARRYRGSSVASEQELGDAMAQLQGLVRQQAERSNPAFAEAMRQADQGYANLVRVEGAAKSAINSDGVFTPGQLLGSIRQSDQSVRKRAVSRGDALMQDLGNAGQQVLGNKVPNSGTADRLWLGAGALATGALNPVIPAGLVGGAAAYSAPVQSLFRAAVASRPQAAKAVAGSFEKAATYLAPGAIPLGLQFNK